MRRKVIVYLLCICLLVAMLVGCVNKPTPASTAPAILSPTPEPETSTELLVGKAKPEAVKDIVYTMSIGDHYTLHREDAGFEAVLETIFSLRGIRCEEPEILVSRSFEMDGSWRITMAYDGKYIYGSRLTDIWLLLDTEGRTDQKLSDIFLQYGEKKTSSFTSLSKNRSMLVDDSIILEAESSSYDLSALFSTMEGFRSEYRESGRLPDSNPYFIVMVHLKNHSGNMIYFGNDISLEVFRNGEWRSIPMRDGYGTFGIGLSLEPGEAYNSLGINLMNYYEETLTAGRYRACMTYSINNDNKGDHVAFAEFEILSDSAVQKADS